MEDLLTGVFILAWIFAAVVMLANSETDYKTWVVTVWSTAFALGVTLVIGGVIEMTV